jgi:hypothetical protein
LLYNKNLGKSGLGFYIKYNKDQLPYFIEWKQTGESDFTVGLEPATWYPEGRSEARKRGELTYIEPGEEKRFDFELGVTEECDTLDNETVNSYEYGNVCASGRHAYDNIHQQDLRF